MTNSTWGWVINSGWRGSLRCSVSQWGNLSRSIKSRSSRAPVSEVNSASRSSMRRDPLNFTRYLVRSSPMVHLLVWEDGLGNAFSYQDLAELHHLFLGGG